MSGLERKHMKIRVVKIAPIIGFGYWKDIYTPTLIGLEGVAHNIILPFLRIQVGYIQTPNKDE